MGLWMGSALTADNTPLRSSGGATAGVHTLEVRIKDLEHHIGRLSLMNQALWELLRERAHLTDDQLLEKAHEIDMRDGIEDGAISNAPLKCPTCGRVSNSRHWKCLYCGQKFEKPIMG